MDADTTETEAAVPAAPHTPATSRRVIASRPLPRTLVCIPGLSSGGPAQDIVRGGKKYSVQEIAFAAISGTIPIQEAAIKALANLRQLNRHELTLVASTLNDLALKQCEVSICAQQAIATLLSAHIDCAEATHLALQVIRLWDGMAHCTTTRASLIAQVEPHIPRAQELRSTTRSHYIERAHVLTQALACHAFAHRAITEIRSCLEDRTPSDAPLRRELAGLVVGTLRKIPLTGQQTEDLKRLATSVFATGLPPSTTNKTTPVIQPRDNDVITAQQAEQRRQYGLALAIELVKSIPLLGRALTAEEYENALRFNSAPDAILPANRFWPTKAEWHTIEKCVLYGAEQHSIAPLRLAALLTILATKIKVEDPTDPRESKRRPDALPCAERTSALAHVQKLQVTHNFSEEDLTSLVDELTARLLAPEFSCWAADAIPAPTLEEAPDKERATAARRREVLHRVLSDPSGKIVPRLQPEELGDLAALTDLELAEFKELCRLLQGRAVSDAFTRKTLLSLAQAPHAQEVTAIVRTAALGNLVNEARRLGSLSTELEREVVAVSAKIPALRGTAPTHDQLPINDDAFPTE